MKIRCAEKSDIANLLMYDKHIRTEELESAISIGRVNVAEECATLTGWLRWNLFWDNIPFMDMLFILEQYRSCGYGRAMTAYFPFVHLRSFLKS